MKILRYQFRDKVLIEGSIKRNFWDMKTIKITINFFAEKKFFKFKGVHYHIIIIYYIIKYYYKILYYVIKIQY